MAAASEPNFLAPQIRCEWTARTRSGGGHTITFELGRILRVCRLVCIVVVPEHFGDYVHGDAFIRFHIDRSQEDPPTGKRPR